MKKAVQRAAAGQLQPAAMLRQAARGSGVARAGDHKMDPAMRQHLEALQSDPEAQQRFEQRPFPALTPSERLHLDVYGFGAPHAHPAGRACSLVGPRCGSWGWPGPE